MFPQDLSQMHQNQYDAMGQLEARIAQRLKELYPRLHGHERYTAASRLAEGHTVTISENKLTKETILGHPEENNA